MVQLHQALNLLKEGTLECKIVIFDNTGSMLVSYWMSIALMGRWANFCCSNKQTVSSKSSIQQLSLSNGNWHITITIGTVRYYTANNNFMLWSSLAMHCEKSGSQTLLDYRQPQCFTIGLRFKIGYWAVSSVGLPRGQL